VSVGPNVKKAHKSKVLSPVEIVAPKQKMIGGIKKFDRFSPFEKDISL